MRIIQPSDIYHHLVTNNIVPVGMRNVGVFVDAKEKRHRRFEQHQTLFGLTPADLNHHAVVIGQTGSGKTTWLQNAIVSRIHHGEAVAVIDPHGDLTRDLLAYIPGPYFSRLMLIDLSDISASVGINVVEKVPPDEQHAKAALILSALKQYFADSWGPRLEHILNHALLAHVSIENSTLLGVEFMLDNTDYREWVVKNCMNPRARYFWTEQFPKHRQSFQQEAIAPIQNKLGGLLAQPAAQNLFGQVASTVNLRWAIDHQRIIIIRLAKGTIGEDNAALIGSILISLLQQAALSRADQQPEARQPFTLVIDEAHTFTTGKSLANSFADLRKYATNLIIASQGMGKWRKDLQDDMLGNAGTTIAFNVSPDDADLLARHFPRDAYETPWDAHTFRELPTFHCAVADRHGEADIYRTLPPLEGPLKYDLVDQALKETRERYQRPRTEIEGKIERWRSNWHVAEDEVRTRKPGR